jgi:toxin-antitoxin system PIN domain toxin
MLVDANLLLYSADESSARHEEASAWIAEVLGGARQVGVPWSSLSAFLRISTNPRVFRSPLDAGAAWSFVDSLLAQETVWVPAPTPRHAEVFRQLMKRHQAGANLVSDVELAALAYEHGLTVCSADHDFARFTEIRWVDPLA